MGLAVIWKRFFIFVNSITILYRKSAIWDASSSNPVPFCWNWVKLLRLLAKYCFNDSIIRNPLCDTILRFAFCILTGFDSFFLAHGNGLPASGRQNWRGAQKATWCSERLPSAQTTLSAKHKRRPATTPKWPPISTQATTQKVRNFLFFLNKNFFKLC